MTCASPRSLFLESTDQWFQSINMLNQHFYIELRCIPSGSRLHDQAKHIWNDFLQCMCKLLFTMGKTWTSTCNLILEFTGMFIIRLQVSKFLHCDWWPSEWKICSIHLNINQKSSRAPICYTFAEQMNHRGQQHKSSTNILQNQLKGSFPHKASNTRRSDVSQAQARLPNEPQLIRARRS